jgi:hypothetical protein
MRNLIFLTLISIILNFIYSCNRVDKIISSEPLQPRIKIYSLSHTSGRIGEKIVAHVKNLDDYDLEYVELNNLTVNFNITSDSLISLFIPFHASNGQFTFYFFSPQFKDTVLLSPSVTIIRDCHTESCISWNSTVPFIESDSWKRLWNGEIITWTKEVYSDTIVLKRNGPCHDECSYWHTVAFKDRGDSVLPIFLYSVYQKEEWLHADVNDTLRSGIVVIDSWKPNQVFSGSYSFEDYSWIFWFNN